MGKTLSLLALFILMAGCEIRPLDPETGRAIIEEGQQAFDAPSFVEENWDTRVLPAIKNDAVALDVLIAELGANQEAASATYGHREGTRPYNFIVRGRGRVVEVDTTSRAGLLLLDLPPSDGASDISLQMGPVIRGTALRDALPFITFNQFVNQLAYANVSNAMHTRLVETVLAGLDLEGLVSQEISFSGVFTLRSLDALLITPVEIRVEGTE
jgi:predicted lipoprotein